MKYAMFLLLFFSSSLLASVADKPVWTINTKIMNLPQKKYSPKEPMDDPNYKVQFTSDDKILISFFESRPQTELITKDKPEKSGRVFIVLLLSKETGELIKRVEWPVMAESTPWQQFQYGSRINPLHSGGYVGIFNRRLQLLDSSFNVMYNRVLETSGNGIYEIIAPLYGQYFILRFREDYRPSSSWVTEIIDSKTFKTIEKFIEMEVNLGIHDIWGDQLLAIGYSNNNYDKEAHLFEKKISALQWNDFGLMPRDYWLSAKFIYNGKIIIPGSIEQASDSKTVWLTIENGERSDPVYSDISRFKPSRNTSIITTKICELSDFRRTLDLNGFCRIKVYDLNTSKSLFTTKKYKDIVDYAISPNGDSIVLMTKKKIELYTVSPSKLKKGDKKN